MSDNPHWLVGVQMLDGVGAGIFGALFPVVVADLTRSTGRFNVSLGAIATATGLGAAISNGVAGVLVVHAGYGTAFMPLGGVAIAGLLLYLTAMPETLGMSGDGAPVAQPIGPANLRKSGVVGVAEAEPSAAR